MRSRNAVLWLFLGLLIVAGTILFVGWIYPSCIHQTPPAPPPVVTVTPPPAPPPAPPPSPYIQQSDVDSWCARQQNPGNWIFLGPDLGTDGTMVIPICYNPDFTAKVDRRLSREGNILRVGDGEYSTATHVGHSGQPGGSSMDWKTLSATFPGKVAVNGKYNGNTVRLLGGTLLVQLPPSAKPPSVYLDECDDFRALPSAPTDRWLREIWTRCQLGTPRQTAVATTMIRTCNSSSCYSRDDGAALDARVRAVEDSVKKNGDKPVPPSQVGYDPSAPSR